MWLITSFLAAIAVTVVYIYAKNPKKFHLDWLCLMLWGLAVMVLIDHSIGFIREGGEFMEVTTEGTLLGIMMLMPLFIVWEIVALISKGRRAKAKGR